METTAKVLETMRSAGKPVSAGEVATLGRRHRITCPLQVAAGRVRTDLSKTAEEAVMTSCPDLL